MNKPTRDAKIEPGTVTIHGDMAGRDVLKKASADRTPEAILEKAMYALVVIAAPVCDPAMEEERSKAPTPPSISWATPGGVGLRCWKGNWGDFDIACELTTKVWRQRGLSQRIGNEWEEWADSLIRWAFIDIWPEELGEQRFVSESVNG